MVPNSKKGSSTSSRKIVNNAPQALIIEPSRELAEQTFEQIKKFKKHLSAPNVRELLVVGGMKVDEQIRALEAGVDIVVATPGRLVDLLQRRRISLLKVCARLEVWRNLLAIVKSAYATK